MTAKQLETLNASAFVDFYARRVLHATKSGRVATRGHGSGPRFHLLNVTTTDNDSAGQHNTTRDAAYGHRPQHDGMDALHNLTRQLHGYLMTPPHVEHLTPQGTSVRHRQGATEK